MVTVKSQRALKLLQNPRFFKNEKSSSMRHFPGTGMDVWVELEWDQQNVKNLSFFGEIDSWQRVLLESMANLLIGKPVTRLDQMSVRECEAFLRDRNSEFAIENLPDSAEATFKNFFNWVRIWPSHKSGEEFVFDSQKGPFRNLKLTDKVRELKGFLNSPEVLSLYQGVTQPSLVDVDELTVYVEAPYSSEKERALFEELHMLGVEAFQEENLNFIPEA